MSSHFNEPLFVISVAARLVKMHPQTLRKYEREGLIAPSRTQGNLRLYSDQDIERLRQVKYLVEDRRPQFGRRSDGARDHSPPAGYPGIYGRARPGSW